MNSFKLNHRNHVYIMHTQKSIGYDKNIQAFDLKMTKKKKKKKGCRGIESNREESSGRGNFFEKYDIQSVEKIEMF